MGNDKIKFQFVHFRNLVIIFIAFTIMFWSYIVIGQTTGERYITVDQDIWASSKYLLVLFVGLLCWIGYEMISILKNLLVKVTDLNTKGEVMQTKMLSIEQDVSEINNKTEIHDARILELEKSQKN